MRLSPVLWLSVCCLLLTTALLVEGRKKGKNGGKKKRNRSKGKGSCQVTAQQLQDQQVKASCGSNLITSLSVVGHHGKCQGLTPDLFVQMNSCFWKKDCTLRYNLSATNYMIKLFKGKMADCVTKEPSSFTISYKCTSKKGTAKLYDVRQAGKSTPKAVSATTGLLRSHADHPWLYKRHDRMTGRSALTVKRPGKKAKANLFVYTISSLNLMTWDNLTVTGRDSSGTVMDTRVFTSLSDVTSTPVSVTGSSDVTFSLDTSLHTNGGEGFVICFQWTKPKKKMRDPCKKLIKSQTCNFTKKKPEA